MDPLSWPFTDIAPPPQLNAQALTMRKRPTPEMDSEVDSEMHSKRIKKVSPWTPQAKAAYLKAVISRKLHLKKKWSTDASVAVAAEASKEAAVPIGTRAARQALPRFIRAFRDVYSDAIKAFLADDGSATGNVSNPFPMPEDVEPSHAQAENSYLFKICCDIDEAEAGALLSAKKRAILEKDALVVQERAISCIETKRTMVKKEPGSDSAAVVAEALAQQKEITAMVGRLVESLSKEDERRAMEDERRAKQDQEQAKINCQMVSALAAIASKFGG
eukprot:scaffold3080_cov133-Pinguiococcus_pyrenoidosus.AAC.1